MQDPAGFRRSVALYAVVVSGWWMASGAFAQVDDPQPITGCGKAHALIGRQQALEAERSDQFVLDALFADGLREAFGDTDVLHYDLTLEVSSLNTSANTCVLAGTNVMTVQSKSANLTQFTFRLRSQFSITSALLNGATPATVTAPTASTRIVTLDRAYGLDEIFTLSITYSGSTVSGGFGSIEVETQGGTPVVATLSEAYYSYTWWPVKDGDVFQPGDNGDKATLDFHLTVPNNYVAPSNGVLLSVDTLSGNRKRYNWSTDYPIAPYLVSFAATNYTKWTKNYNYLGGSMPVEFYIYPGNDTTSNRTAWEKCINMLGVYANYYGLYPFINEKYGMYNFNFGGGMEHQTMTGMGTFSESVNAHELAHQWWGDMITCRTWGDIWLNEGFATFSECLWDEFKSGTQNTAAYFSATQLRKPSSVGDSVYVYDTASMSRIFSTTYTYNKGCWVLHQLRGVVGDATFFAILADYRAAYEYSAATTDQFAAVASGTAGKDLTWFFDQWVYGIGAPAYGYAWSNTIANGQNYLLARIRQTHTTSGYPSVFTMPIRLRVTIGGVNSIVTVWNDARTEWFVVPTAGPVTALSFDPDQWILRTGASSDTFVAGPPTIVALTPAPGDEIVGGGANAITVTFHTPVNATAAAFTLRNGANELIPTAFTYDAPTNTATLTPLAALAVDTYTVTVADSITATNSGLALDGELANPNDALALPSGDGLAGGAAVFSFVVGCTYGDTDCDRDIDLEDYALFQQCFRGANLGFAALPGCANLDYNDDADVDGDDYDAFAARYGGPDPIDCNLNGVPDDQDLALGFAADCNSTGIPDECELAAADCNENAIPDECELAGNDCNANAAPDECDPREVLYGSNFEVDDGWTTSFVGATSGYWQRGVPVNNPNWTYAPIADSDGSGQCWLTENLDNPAYAVPYNTDVDAGSVTLTSPTLDLAATDVVIRYDYYLRLLDTTTDALIVEINTADGVGAWTEIARHNADGLRTWRTHEIDAADLAAAGVTPSSTTKLRFTAADNNPQSVVEAGLDAMMIVGLECTN